MSLQEPKFGEGQWVSTKPCTHPHGEQPDVTLVSTLSKRGTPLQESEIGGTVPTSVWGKQGREEKESHPRTANGTNSSDRRELTHANSLTEECTPRSAEVLFISSLFT